MKILAIIQIRIACAVVTARPFGWLIQAKNDYQFFPFSKKCKRINVGSRPFVALFRKSEWNIRKTL
jgi:hypothetical protein